MEVQKRCLVVAIWLQGRGCIYTQCLSPSIVAITVHSWQQQTDCEKMEEQGQVGVWVGGGRWQGGGSHLQVEMEELTSVDVVNLVVVVEATCKYILW